MMFNESTFLILGAFGLAMSHFTAAWWFYGLGGRDEARRQLRKERNAGTSSSV